MKMTENFSLDEFLFSESAVREGIDNTPSPGVVDNLLLVAQFLEKVRKIIKRPITIGSGYRCGKLNVKVGGSPTSTHVLGLAADISASGYSPYELAAIIRDRGLLYDQLILEYKIANGKPYQVVHIGLDQRMRQQTLTQIINEQGNIAYREGLMEV